MWSPLDMGVVEMHVYKKQPSPLHSEILQCGCQDWSACLVHITFVTGMNGCMYDTIKQSTPLFCVLKA
jgi:hypothetical protein